MGGAVTLDTKPKVVELTRVPTRGLPSAETSLERVTGIQKSWGLKSVRVSLCDHIMTVCLSSYLQCYSASLFLNICIQTYTGSVLGLEEI